MWIEKVLCPNCGKLTSKDTYCKFCGKPLEVKPQTLIEGKTLTKDMPTVSESTSSTTDIIPPAQEVVEERKIVEQLSTFHNWRNRLLELLLNGEASVDVFTDIYREYRMRITAVNEKRLQMIKELEEKINDLTARLENLKIRHEVGEIQDKQYITEKLNIDRELSKLKPKLNILHNAFNVKIVDVPRYETKIRELRESVSERGRTIGLTDEDVGMIVSDLNEVLEGIQSLMEVHKRLTKELEKVELRHKVGELTDEEYEAMKQKIRRQMEM
ncbi:MAG: zinc ribbon domain-containing protein [Candidatus Caldarchaeales archaeon]